MFFFLLSILLYCFHLHSHTSSSETLSFVSSENKMFKIVCYSLSGGVAGGQERQHINPLTHDNKNVSEKSQCILRTSTVLARLAVHRETCSTSSCLPRVFFLFFYRSMVRSILFISLPPTSLCYNWWKWCKITINTGKFLLTTQQLAPSNKPTRKKNMKNENTIERQFYYYEFSSFPFRLLRTLEFSMWKIETFPPEIQQRRRRCYEKL